MGGTWKHIQLLVYNYKSVANQVNTWALKQLNMRQMHMTTHRIHSTYANTQILKKEVKIAPNNPNVNTPQLVFDWTHQARSCSILERNGLTAVLWLTCGPGILYHIFAEGWLPCGSFGIGLSAANLGLSSEFWYRLSEIYLLWASPSTLPVQPWRRSLSYQTGTCRDPERQHKSGSRLTSEHRLVLYQ